MLLQEPLDRFIKDCLLQGTVLGTVPGTGGGRGRTRERGQHPAPKELTIWVGDRRTDKDSWATNRRSETTRHSHSSPGVPVPPTERTHPGLQLLRRTSRRTDGCGRLHRPPGTLGTWGRGAWGVCGGRGSGKVIAGGGSRATQRHRGETGSKGGLGSEVNRLEDEKGLGCS